MNRIIDLHFSLRNTFFLRVCLLLFIGLPPLLPVSAIMTMNPNVCEVDARAGMQKQLSVTVLNDSQESLNCHSSTMGFSMSEDGTTLQSSEPNAKYDATAWIACTPTDFRLDPGKKQIIKCVVIIPKNCSGSYYTFVSVLGIPVIRSSSTNTTGAAINVNMSFRASCVVLIAVKNGNPQPELAIRNIDLRPNGNSLDANKSWQIFARVENTGALYSWTMGSAEIRNGVGNRVWQGALSAGQGLLAPGYPRLYTNATAIILPDGDYNISLLVSAKGTRQTITASQVFRLSQGKAMPVDAAGPAWARTSPLALSSQEVSFMGIPAGAQRQQTLQLKNLSDKPMRYLVEMSGWRVTEDNMGEFCSVEQDPQGSANWIEVTPREVTLAPNAITTLRIVAKVPPGIAGEHFCALLLKPQVENGLATSVLVSVVPQKTEKSSAEVKIIGIAEDKASKYNIKTQVRNTGNVRIAPSLTISIIDEKGKQVGEIISSNEEQRVILPGAVQQYVVIWEKPLLPGKYTLKVSAKLTLVSEAISNSTEFTIPLADALPMVTKDTNGH